MKRQTKCNALRSFVTLLAATTVSGVHAEAQADPVRLSSPSGGYVYFNRPGADWEQLTREMVECVSIAERANVPWKEQLEAFRGIVPQLIESGKAAGARTANVENCMVVRGWRVVELNQADGAAVAGLDRAAKADVLRQWVGADQPKGVVVRVWANDAGNAATVKQGMPPMSSRRSLSEGAIEAPKTELPVYEIKLAASIKLDAAKPLGPAEVARLEPGGQAVIVATLIAANPRGDSMRGVGRLEAAERNLGGFGLGLANGGWASLEREGKLRLEGLALNIFDRSRKEDPIVRTEVFLVSPGRWVFATNTLKLCLGAPFFEAKAGDVIYAGAFDMRTSALSPDMNLAPAQAHLNGSGDLLSKLKPAQWQNGHAVSCDGPFTLLPIYALEFPDAPYAEGYRRAGRP